jgi:chromosome partitioning protein
MSEQDKMAIEDVAQRAGVLIKYAQQVAVQPDEQKPPIGFSTAEVAALIGRTPKTIKAAEAVVGKPSGEKTTGSIVRRVYSVGDIRKLRQHLRPKDYMSRCMTISVIGYKGGSAKSTTVQSLAHCLARRGYRVLVVDTDPQATTTQIMLAVAPDSVIETHQTIAPVFFGHESVVGPPMKTNWETVDIVPARNDLHAADFTARESGIPYSALHDGLSHHRDNYDFVLIDTPPTLSVLSMAATFGADAVVVPVPPRMPDLASTATYSEMICTYWKRHGIDVPIVGLLRTLVSRAEPVVINPAQHNPTDERKLMDAMQSTFGGYLLSGEVLVSSLVTRLAGMFRTIYESDSRDKAWQRAISGYEEACDDLLGRLKLLDQEVSDAA